MDAIPHDPSLAAGNGVLEVDYLAGVQRGISVDGPKSAVAIVHQAARDLLPGRSSKDSRNGLVPGDGVGTAIGGWHN